MANSNVEPYLFFGGRCDEALAFYRGAVGAEVVFVMHFNESPKPVPPEMLQAGFETKVMHALFRIGNSSIMASDGCDDKSRFGGFSLALNVDDEAQARLYFSALSQGGEIQMPLAKTFWSPCYGTLTDRFGVNWMVMVPGEAPE